MKKKGKITTWNDDKGFGFITIVKNKQQVFVHISSFKKKDIRPIKDDMVTFTLSNDKDGRSSAKDVILFSNRVSQTKSNSINLFLLSIIIGFMAFLVYFTLLGNLPIIVIGAYIIMGIITYWVYVEDKSRATNSEYRISENFLHLLSLLGGWMGAIIVQQKIRHKNKKISFQVIFWITVIVNIFFLTKNFMLLSLRL